MPEVVRGPLWSGPEPLGRLTRSVFPERVYRHSGQRSVRVGPVGLQLVEDQGANDALDALDHAQSPLVDPGPSETQQLEPA